MLTVAHRYQQVVRGLEYRRAAHPRDVDVINQLELEAAIAPVTELTDQLQDVAPEMDRFFDAYPNDRRAFKFHAGADVSGLTGQTNWLGELLLHGQDIARAVKAPWKLAERDMLLIHIHHGIADIRPCRADDRPDAVLRLPASVLTQVLYQRIGPLGAARRGLLVVGGRRPWVALKLQAYFERALVKEEIRRAVDPARPVSQRLLPDFATCTPRLSLLRTLALQGVYSLVF